MKRIKRVMSIMKRQKRIFSTFPKAVTGHKWPITHPDFMNMSGVTIDRKWQWHLSCFVILICIALWYPSFSFAVPTHLDKKNVKTGGCSDCHKGHGKKGTTMLTRDKGDFCFQCHSLSGKATDIYSELLKPSNHRILQTAQYHIPGEELPERDPSVQRHASCYDCHNVHKSDKNDRLKGLRGYSGIGGRVKQVTKGYELCYNCHSDSANMRSEGSNVSLDFSAANASFHPIETSGRNSFVPSLKRGRGVSRMVDCSDCHGNNDPFGPKGPHGSIYEPILKYRYVRTPGVESPLSYELCYSCHERNSIIGDQSFRAHKAHIVYNQNSCAQCHDAHGSIFNPALIKFDTTVVFPNSFGEITFQPISQGRPRCYLSCHINGKNVEHKLDEKLGFNVNKRVLPDW